MERESSRRKAALRIVARVFGVLAVAFAVLAIVHQTMTHVEKRKYPAPGVLVDVEGRKMHVYVEGSGPLTIVLLSGANSPCPVHEFRPLLDRLRSSYRVTVVEYFGYGWSERTSRPRSVENIVEETRAALGGAGVRPPYVLMPHSMSGIYALYYASRYPDEVSAVLGIDVAVPELLLCAGSPSLTRWFDLLTFLGIVRAATWLSPRLAGIPVLAETDFSEHDVRMLAMMTSRQTFNSTIVDEVHMEVANARTTESMRFADDLPVLMFLSRDSVDGTGMPTCERSWMEMHAELIGEGDRIVVLEGGHNLHYDCSEELAAEASAFLSAHFPAGGTDVVKGNHG